jgi:DNA-binding GntR family transcriptional regulator
MIDHISKYLDKNRGLKLGQTAADLIYENLRESILKRKLVPNERIKIRDISNFLGVSQTPVREAIQRLAAEKFITVTAHSEIRVIDLNIEESQNLSELIQILDWSGMKKIYKTISDDYIAQLRQMTDKMGEQYAGGKIKAYIEQNIAIHKAVWHLYDNEAIQEVLTQSVERLHLVERHYMSYFLDKKFLERSWHDHSEYVEAIADRDWAGVERIILRHWVYPK